MITVVPSSTRGEATLMLRPEQLTIDEVSVGGSGVVESADFYGSEVVLTIRLGTGCDAGAAPIIRVPQRSNFYPPVGSTVRIRVTGQAMAYAR
jgi:iron(III) transport system ATP-binding protein